MVYILHGLYFEAKYRASKEDKCRRFSKEQEVARKNVEHIFGVRQSCWDIVRHLATA
jgi:hypothetical protein